MVGQANRRPDHDDIGFDDALAQHRPSVAFAFVRFDAGFDIVIDRADDIALGAMLCEGIEQLLQKDVGRRFLAPAGTFKAAVEGQNL